MSDAAIAAVPTISVQGWGMQRVSGGTEWKPRWMLIQHGTLLWFLDESAQMPEDIVSLAGSQYKRTGELLEKGEEVLAIMCKGKGTAVQTVYIAVNSYESPLWTTAIKIHTEANADLEQSIEETLNETLADYDDHPEEVTGEVSFNKVPQYLTVGIEDDTSEKVTDFLEEHAPTRIEQYHTSVENVVLKLLLESCVVFQDKQRKHMAYLRRRMSGVVSAEQRALSAEEHASHIGNSIGVMEKNVTILTQTLASSKAASDNKTMEIARLTKLLQEAGISLTESKREKERLASMETKLANSESDVLLFRAQIAKLEEELVVWRKGDMALLRKELTYALKELKEARRQKALKEKTVQDCKVEMEKTKQELRVMYGVQAGRSRDSMANQETAQRTANDDLGQGKAVAALAAEKAALISEKTTMLETLGALRMQLEDSGVARGAAEDEAFRLTDELKQWEASPLVGRVTTLSEENRSLREQIMKLHAEVVRVTGKLEDVRQAAVDAVKLLHTLKPNSQVMEMLSKVMGSHASSSAGTAPGSGFGSISGTSGLFAPTHSNSSSPGRPLTSQMLSSPSAAVSLPETPASSSAPMIAARDQWDIYADVPYMDDIIAHHHIRLSIFHKLYEKYSSDQGVITHSRFIRFTKEYLLTPHASGASVQHVPPQHQPMLVAGDIDLIFKAAIKSDPEDHKAPFGTGPRMFVRRSQTSAASNMVFHQFIQAISMLARKLYAGFVEERYGTVLEYLPIDQREPAAQDLMVDLIKGKVLGGMAHQNMVPFPMFFVERTLMLLSTRSNMFGTLAECAPRLVQWFTSYADIRAPDTFDDDVSTYMSFKALLRFAHDFGLVPFLSRESQLFSLFEELLVWKRGQGERLLNLLPGELLRLAGAEVGDLSTPPTMEHTKQPRTAAIGFPSAVPPPSLKTLNIESHRGNIGPGVFGLLLVLVSVQGFPDHPEDARMDKLIDWMAQSAGGSEYQN